MQRTGRQGHVNLALSVFELATKDARSDNGHRAAALQWLSEPETQVFLEDVLTAMCSNANAHELIERVTANCGDMAGIDNA